MSDVETRSTDPPPAQPDFRALLEWIISRAGGPNQIIRDGIVSDETLRRWRRGKVPNQRSSVAVEAVEKWARTNVAGYPPRWAPPGGLVTLAGKQPTLDGRPPVSAPREQLGPEPPPPPTTPPAPTHQPGEPAHADQGRPRRRYGGRRWAVGLGAVAIAVVAIGIANVPHHAAPNKPPADPTPSASVAATITEYSDNRNGSPVFADPDGSPVSHGLAGRIPFGTQVAVTCVAEDRTGIKSVTALYRISGGTWDGMFVVTDTMTNGGAVGATDTPTVDPRVPAC